jgi:hypothetical protein
MSMRWLRLFVWWLLSRPLEQDCARAWRWLLEHPEPVVLALGILLRVVVYAENRGYFLDEGLLNGNITNVPVFAFSHPLTGYQLAPPGFLIIERTLTATVGSSPYVTRFFPLVSGIAAIILFSRLVHRVLPPRGALVALSLFAFSDDLVHYSSELKPYSLDMAVGLAITLMAFLALGTAPAGGRAVVLAVCVAVAPWLSFPSAFIVAGCGLSLICVCLSSRRYHDAMIWGMFGAIWLASFVASYRAALALLDAPDAMYRFWNFAFLPVWPLPMNLTHLLESAGILLEIFVNPLHLVAPFWPWLGVMLPLLLMLAGGTRLARQSLPAWALLVVPITLALVASATKRYPLHGRLILELVPAFLILIAAGTDSVRDFGFTGARLVYALALLGLLAYPTLAVLYRATFPGIRDFNRHGDIHANLFLRYRESPRVLRQRPRAGGDGAERSPEGGSSSSASWTREMQSGRISEEVR